MEHVVLWQYEGCHFLASFDTEAEAEEKAAAVRADGGVSVRVEKWDRMERRY